MNFLEAWESMNVFSGYVPMLQGVIRGRISPDGFPASGGLGGAGSESDR